MFWPQIYVTLAHLEGVIGLLDEEGRILAVGTVMVGQEVVAV
jgi:hypothetical protein